VLALKHLKKHDVSFIKRGAKTLEEFSFLMGLIDGKARRLGIYKEDQAKAKDG
jgi:hypothetical protein